VLIRHQARRIHDRNEAEVRIARTNNAEAMNSAGRAPSALSAAKNTAPITTMNVAASARLYSGHGARPGQR